MDKQESREIVFIFAVAVEKIKMHSLCPLNN